MKTTRAMLLAALLGITPLTGVPQAAAQVSEIDYHMAMSSITHAGSRASKVAALKRVPGVGVIRLDVRTVPRFMTDVPDPSDFKILARKNAGGIAKLQRALAGNPVTRDVLARRGIDVGQVAGVQVSSNGSLRLYIFSRWDVLR